MLFITMFFALICRMHYFATLFAALIAIIFYAALPFFYILMPPLRHAARLIAATRRLRRRLRRFDADDADIREKNIHRMIDDEITPTRTRASAASRILSGACAEARDTRAARWQQC